MATTIVGLFDGITQADCAVRVLVGSGFNSEDISILTHDSNGEAGSTGGVKRNESVTGGGGILSELGNIIHGRLTVVVPAIGLLVATGPLATTLARTTLGTPACGLLEALTAIGILEEHGGYYAEGVRRGGTLVAVRTADRLADRAEDIMKIHKAVNMQKRMAQWQHSGWVTFTPEAKPFSLEEAARERAIAGTEHKQRASDFNRYDTDFRSHFFIMTEETIEASYRAVRPCIPLWVHACSQPTV